MCADPHAAATRHGRLELEICMVAGVAKEANPPRWNWNSAQGRSHVIQTLWVRIPASPPDPASHHAVRGIRCRVGRLRRRGDERRAAECRERHRTSDRPFAQAKLVDRWVAQLSSKRPGLVAPDVNGRMVTWTPCEILQQHVRMRGEYPEVRLVWSDEWRTFDLAGWWVTVAGVTFPDGDAANGWCDARAIPVDECYAKAISNTNDSGRTTKYRR